MEFEATGGPDPLEAVRDAVIGAALPHVVFDGWSQGTLARAIAESGVDAGLAALALPRGPIDLALGFHRLMDRRLAAELAQAPGGTKIRERIAHAVRRRLELVEPEREAVRRGVTLMALPMHVADGARAIWGTADVIWNACGDTSEDYNWYTKRAILSGVYSATTLFWLGDESMGATATWAFLDRRIDNVMQFEKTKAAAQANPLLRGLFWGPAQILARVRAPARG